MANSNQPSPLDEIMSGLNTDTQPQESSTGSIRPASSTWEEFRSLLEESATHNGKGRMHSIDADLLDTLAQCHFDVSLNRVINSMLRAFMKSHIGQLREMRQTTLFETL